MKRIIRTLIFSATSLYLTSLWNKGVVLSFKPTDFIILVLALVALNYIINPLMKVILFPFNLITLGTISLIVYFFLFHLLVQYFSIIKVTAWTFNGFYINYYLNLALTAISISFIINFLELCL